MHLYCSDREMSFNFKMRLHCKTTSDHAEVHVFALRMIISRGCNCSRKEEDVLLNRQPSLTRLFIDVKDLFHVTTFPVTVVVCVRSRVCLSLTSHLLNMKRLLEHKATQSEHDLVSPTKRRRLLVSLLDISPALMPPFVPLVL